MSDETNRKGEWLQCKECGGPVEFNEQTFIGKCDQCLKEADVREQTNLIERTMSSLSEAIELIESKKRYQAEELLLNMQRQLSDTVHTNSVYMRAIKRELSRCHEDLGQWQKAIEYRTQCMLATEIIYGEKSVEMLHEMKKMSDLHFENIQSEEEKFQVLRLTRSCLVVTSKAAKLIENYPEMNNDLDTLNERLAYLVLLENSITNVCFPQKSNTSTTEVTEVKELTAGDEEDYYNV